MEEMTFMSADGKTRCHAVLWRPAGKPRGIVQIIHGMAEYGARYAPLGEYLAEHGYLAAAADHLGHGGSVLSRDDLGYFCADDPVGTVLRDIRSFSVLLREEEGDAPFFLLGHSMGSFFLREYISLYGTEYDGAVIVGTGYQGALMTGAGKAVNAAVSLFRGERHRSRAVNSLAFGSYNRKIKPARTPFDWLSADGGNVDRYIADPLCGVPFTCNGFRTLFGIVSLSCRKATFEATPDSLPIFLISGDGDPVGNYSAGVEKVYRMYLAAGAENIRIKIYKGGRHEILNDFCAAEVRADILSFVGECEAGKAGERSGK